MAGALDNLGTLAMDLGNFPQARAWLEESLELQLPLGAPGYIATLTYLSKLGMYEGNLVEARAYGDEVRAMSEKAGMMMAFQYLWSLAYIGTYCTARRRIWCWQKRRSAMPFNNSKKRII